MLSKFQGFNAALTEAVDIPGRRGTDQVKEMNSKLRPELKGPLTVLCNDPKSTIVILSGSTRNVLDDVEYESLKQQLVKNKSEIIGFKLD